MVLFRTYSHLYTHGGRLGRLAALPLRLMSEIITNIDIGPGAKIGPGLLLPHGGTIVIHGGAKIGASATILHGTTIGNVRPRGGVPIIGDNVSLGAYSQVLGDIRIGDNVRIGALALVLEDVPSGATVLAPRGTISRN